MSGVITDPLFLPSLEPGAAQSVRGGAPHHVYGVQSPDDAGLGWVVWGDPDREAHLTLRPVRWSASPDVLRVQAEALWRAGHAVRWDAGGVARTVTGLAIDGAAAFERAPFGLLENLINAVRMRLGINPLTRLPNAVAEYLGFSASLAEFQPEDDAGLQGEARFQIRDIVRRARVIQIASSDVARLHDLAWAAFGTSDAQADGARYEEIHDDLQRLPFPEDGWPFDDLFLGWSSPLGILEGTSEWNVRGLAGCAGGSARSVGLFASRTERRAFELLMARPAQGPRGYLPVPIYDGSRWGSALTMMPLILGSILADLRGRSALVPVPLRADKRSAPRVGNTRTRRPPPPHVPAWYPLRLERLQVVPIPPPPSGVVAHNADGDRVVQGRSYSYRWDRRRHERVYVRSGSGRPTVHDRAYLARLGYRIVEPGPDYEADLRRLQDRAVEVPTGGWVALKVRLIEPSVCGPDHLPYKPATRVIDEVIL